jgi:hypothetical protein
MTTALLTLAATAAGLAFCVGAREMAARILWTVLAVILGIVFTRCFLCWLANSWTPSSSGSPPDGWGWLLVLLILITVGALAWKTRAARQRRLEDVRRRHMHPRRAAPPSVPNVSPDDEEFLP